VPKLAELAKRTSRAEEDHLVPYTVIGVNEVPLPAASVMMSTLPALDAKKLG
jgi:hypothetical protein